MDRFGIPLKVRQDRLGHVDSRMILGVYTHSAGEDSKRAARELGAIVWGRVFEISDANCRKLKTA
jgi:integrase